MFCSTFNIYFFFVVEVMTYVAWRLSDFQPFKVIGFGTVLESAMLKQLIAKKLECSIKNVQAFVGGEQATYGGKDYARNFLEYC